MAEIDDDKIRAVAYDLWQRDGAPDGRDEDYWHAAVKLLADEGQVTDPDTDLVASLAIPAAVVPTLVK